MQPGQAIDPHWRNKKLLGSIDTIGLPGGLVSLSIDGGPGTQFLTQSCMCNRSNLPINRQVEMHKMFSKSSQTDSPMNFIAPLRRTLHSTTPKSHAKGHPFNATRTVLLRAYLRTYTLAASGQAFCPQLRLRTRRIRYTLHESCFQSPFLNCKKRRSKNRILSYPPKRSSIEPHSYHYSHFYLFSTD